MSDVSLEERVKALETKVAAIEEYLRLNPPRKGILALFDGPPPTPEEQAVFDEVQRYIRVAREDDMAELNREAQRERCDPGEA
jgi:hypothetical protein